MKKIEFIYFDVANTLLHKPEMEENYWQFLQKINPAITKEKFYATHKTISENIQFPDNTVESFYEFFNTQLLTTLGIEPTQNRLDEIYAICANKPWIPYEDTKVLEDLKVPFGVITNFSKKVKNVLQNNFSMSFAPIIISEEVGVQKPSQEIFQTAIDACGVAAENILYIGDSYRIDYLPASKLGMQSFLIDRHKFYPSFPYIISSLAVLKQI